MDDANTPGDACELCGRHRRLTFHHLIPRTVHSNRWFKKRFSRAEMSQGLYLCRFCHGYIHRLYTEKELGRSFNTREALLSDDRIRRWVEWAQKHG